MDHSYQEEERASKRARIDQNDHDSTEHLSSEQVPLSVEQHLSIPAVVIFRRATSSNRSKPLLTRAEAQAMLRINMLSQEVDCLVQLASEALDKKRWCKFMETTLISHPILRSLVPILHCHGKNQPIKALAYVQQQLSRVLHEMTLLVTMFQQFAEQNFTLAESLLDALGDNALAEEKKLLGDLEEEISVRCNELLQMTEEQRSSQMPEEKRSSPTQNRSSMHTFCELLFGESFNDPQRHHMDSIMEEDQQVEKTVEELSNKFGNAMDSCDHSKLPSDIGSHVNQATTGAVVVQLASTPTKNVGNNERSMDVANETLNSANFTMTVPGAIESELDTDCTHPTRREDVCPSISPAMEGTHYLMAEIERDHGETVSPCNESPKEETGNSRHLIPENKLEGEITSLQVPNGQSIFENEESPKQKIQNNRMGDALAVMIGAEAAKSPQKGPSFASETLNISGETHVNSLPHESPPSTRGRNGHSKYSPMPSPHLCESDNEMMPNTQNAVNALAGLSYGY